MRKVFCYAANVSRDDSLDCPSPDNPPDNPLDNLRLTADGSATLYSSSYAQTLHSHKGALAEARHVFLQGAGVVARAQPGASLRVLEVGLGTGLNFLLTADTCWQQGAQLHYIALEHTLLPSASLQALAYGQYLQQPALWVAWLEWYQQLAATLSGSLTESITGSVMRWQWAQGSVLELRLGEATRQQLAGLEVDAIYHDAFSPEANPELWQPAFLQTLYHALAPQGILSSYCVKGQVRRDLQALGWAVRKQPGPPGGKREMLQAAKDAAVLETLEKL